MTRTQILVLDLETCSTLDVTEVGADAYARHPTTWVRCAVLGFTAGRGELDIIRWLPGQQAPARAVRHLLAGGRIAVHNWTFEASMFAHCPALHGAAGWPEIEPSQWIDTAEIAALLGLPVKLEGLAAVLGCPTQKDIEGAKVMRRLARHGYEPTDAEVRRLLDYCEADVRATAQALWRLPSIPAVEQRVIEVNREINLRGMAIDIELGRAMRDLAGVRADELAGEVFRATSAAVSAPTQLPALKAWVVGRGVPLPRVKKVVDRQTKVVEGLSREAIGQLLASDTLPGDVRTALQGRVEYGRTTSLSKLARIETMVADDGRLRQALRYCGAHTGRWSSSGIQVHNLPRVPKALAGRMPALREAIRARDVAAIRAIEPDLLAALSYSLRSLIVAPQGCDLVGGDYSAIEARVLAWIAGQADVLDMFDRGIDVYVHDAAQVGSTNRQLGKTLRLGLGYGMGSKRFHETAARDGVPLTLLDARKLVRGWRAANPTITEFWSALERAWRDALASVGSPIRVGRLTVVAGAQVLRIVLPSGRALHYWRPGIGQPTIKRVETVTDAGAVEVREITVSPLTFFAPSNDLLGMAREEAYGGLLAENITQAIARDVLAAATVRLAGSPYLVVVHVHDSVAVEVPTGHGSVDEFGGLLTMRPAWAPDLPMATDNYRSHHFKG